MNKILATIILLPLLLLFTGCPVNTSYPLSQPGSEKIDESLIGTWENNSDSVDGDVLKVRISRKDKFTYLVSVLKQGSMYMAKSKEFEAFVTKFEGRNFFYLRPVGKTDEYFLYNYTMNDTCLSTFDVGLKVGGLDAVTSTKAFRKEVAASLKMEDCLGEEIKWTRTGEQ
jgi:hypothetical protein